MSMRYKDCVPHARDCPTCMMVYSSISENRQHSLVERSTHPHPHHNMDATPGDHGHDEHNDTWHANPLTSIDGAVVASQRSDSDVEQELSQQQQQHPPSAADQAHHRRFLRPVVVLTLAALLVAGAVGAFVIYGMFSSSSSKLNVPHVRARSSSSVLCRSLRVHASPHRPHAALTDVHCHVFDPNYSGSCWRCPRISTNRGGHAPQDPSR